MPEKNAPLNKEELSNSENEDVIYNEKNKKYESWSPHELYKKAEKMNITGRGDMDKDRLIEAIREKEESQS